MKKYLYLAAFFAVMGLFLNLGWDLWGPKPPKPETYAPETRQADNSLVLERKPQPAANPAHVLPAGGKLERVVRVEVKSRPVNVSPALQAGAGATEAPAALVDCPPVQVDMSIVKMPDDSRRVITSSPNGRVLGGLDIPVEASRPVTVPKWAAGITANPLDRTFGVFVDRDLGPFRLGGEVNQINSGIEFRIKAGLRF